MATNVFPDGDESYDFLFKLVLVGDPGVGKTCVVQRYKHGVFTERQANTIGVDFTLKTIDVDGKRVKVSCSVSITNGGFCLCSVCQVVNVLGIKVS